MRKLFGLGLIWAMVMTVFQPAPSSAHLASNYFSGVWFDLTVPWHFTVGIPDSGGFRARIRDAADTWSALSPPLSFIEGGEVANYAPYTLCENLAYQENAVHYYAMVDDLGRTYKCIRGANEMYAFQLAIDIQDNWYLGEPTPPPSNEYDLQSTATHEFGHSAGWSIHFKGTGPLCDQTPYHTMCPTIGLGAAYFRSLEDHDRHTFDDAY